MQPTLSLIINTYEQPEYLGRVLQAVGRQGNFVSEVLLADDGSGEATAKTFAQWAKSQSIRCEHVRQAHEGFRRARILNQAIAAARGDYLVFLDGDTVPHPRFLQDHGVLAARKALVQGHRALVEDAAAAYFGKNDFWRGQVACTLHMATARAEACVPLAASLAPGAE